jgi:hypothetical protein
MTTFHSQTTSTIHKHHVLKFLLIWLCLAGASIAWSMATPIGASPDEPAHIIKAAAVAQGQLIGEPTSEAAVILVDVPQSIAQAGSWPCYAFNPDVSAGCIPVTSSGTNLVESSTSAGLYNPTYYALVGWTSVLSPDGPTVVYLMRIMSSIIVSFFLTIGLVGLLSLTRPLIGGITFFTIATPMVFFLSGVVNPNALEISSGIAFLISLLWIFRNKTSAPGRLLWLASLVLSGIALANSRGISPFWLGVFVLFAVIATDWSLVRIQLRNWGFLLATGLVFAGTIFAGIWVLFTGTLSSMGTFPGAGEVSPLRAFFTMIVQKSIDPGLVGVFGWLDTFAPAAVYFIWSLLIGAISVAALILARGKKLVIVLVSLLSMVMLPALIQAASVQRSGFIWQGRYSLIIFAGAMIMCALIINHYLKTSLITESQSRIFWIVSILVIFGQILAFVSALGRYVVGNSGAIFAALGGGEWSPPLGGLVWVALLGLSIGTLLAIWNSSIRRVASLDETDLPEYQAAVR